MDQSKQLGEEKVLKLLLKFSIPAIIGMLVNALYNVVDRIFIGNGVGSLGIAGITIGFPIMLFIMACGMLIGLGANALISIKLGEGKKEEAERILGNALVLLIGISLAISIVGSIFLEPLLKIFGASEAVLPYAREYLQIILWGAVFQSIGFGMNNFIRAEGNPKIAMYTMLIGALLNTALDPLFIFVFNWGIRGAALATIISQAVSSVWVLYHFLGGRSTLKIRAANLKLHIPTVNKIAALGSAPFAMQIAASFLNVLMNRALTTYGGDVAISGMGVITSIITLILMPIFGINQGVQPIIGYNYGACKFDRVKEALKLGILGATIIVMIGFVGTRLFPEQMVAFFNREDAELIAFGTRAIKIFMVFLPIIGFQVVSASYFQAIGKPKQAAFLTLSRQVIFLIPALLILPKIFGLDGVLMAGPLADLLSSILTGIWIIVELKNLGRQHEASFGFNERFSN
ncbi:MATE family efflux transporter [Clostridium formicaceticum]|uniref:Multidrug export protein MepA n=1 Tax=Clostridium formicaceticum TaxID=1497 RepID=A0AAC9RNP2_9CLOT|nr:MATE family efflux transporter [Clostridium formicaceticum]AOY74929.1 MATE family efflux transporter [Clostridium formicaceticum]ARE89336.1 Multidrug export protein MepA [Clostridium formicaceticum]